MMCITLLLGFTLPLYAGQYYSVEVVLFKHLNTQGMHDEYWTRPKVITDNTPENILSDNSINSNPEQNILNNDRPIWAEYNKQNQQFLPMTNGISQLRVQSYRLTGVADHLRFSDNYKLLAHFGWVQGSRSKQRALPIRLTSNKFATDIIPIGELKLYASRFLHIQVDLKATQCTDTDKTSEHSSQACVNQVYTFKQNRKMRSRELHYLDNPVFGMLIYVTPFSS